MDRETTYRKTAAGADAIATRSAGLTPRQRSLLILVDGKRSAAELAVLTAASGDSRELLQGLLEGGFIEAVARPVAPAVKPAMRAAAEGIPLPQARSLAARRLTDLLGPSATDLCIKLESSRSADEFRAVLQGVEGILREVVGTTRATQFVAEVEGLRAT